MANPAITAPAIVELTIFTVVSCRAAATGANPESGEISQPIGAPCVSFTAGPRTTRPRPRTAIARRCDANSCALLSLCKLYIMELHGFKMLESNWNIIDSHLVPFHTVWFLLKLYKWLVAVEIESFCLIACLEFLFLIIRQCSPKFGNSPHAQLLGCTLTALLELSWGSLEQSLCLANLSFTEAKPRVAKMEAFEYKNISKYPRKLKIVGFWVLL